MQKLFTGIALLLICASFKSQSLKGKWEYCGGQINGKLSAAPNNYKLQRNYKGNTFEAFVLEPGEEPFKYETGEYKLNADTCFETQTFCAQPSATLNKTITYTYTIANDTLTLNGTLPNGAVVHDYWKKIK